MAASPGIDILIVGAGPTGLVAAIEAARHGLSVRVIDKKPRRSTTSKALVVHARTLEVFETIGVVASILRAGARFAALNVTPNPRRAPIRIDLLGLAWGDTRYPYWLSIPQHETERCLEEHLATLGVRVEWGVALRSLSAVDAGVEAELEGPAGARRARARWLVGCDGGRSRVRDGAGLGFERSSLDETFVLADVCGAPGLPEDEGAAVLAPDGVMFVVPMPERGRWRIIAHVRDPPGDAPITIDAAYLDAMFSARLSVDFGARDVTWSSQFVLTQGVATRYRAGRVFIAGDAAHLHSPVGGQGLNTGVQDAHALIWRIAQVERAGAPCEPLLDSYEAERGAIARAMVAATTRATRLITLGNPLLRRVRGIAAGFALRRGLVQQRFGRGIGMLDLVYARSPGVVAGPRGASGPGGRLPDPQHDGRRLSELLHPLRHTVLVLDDGERGDALWAQLQARGLARVRVGAAAEGVAPRWIEPQPGALRRGLGGARVVVVRPDRVIATSAKTCSIEQVARYARGLDAPLESL